MTITVAKNMIVSATLKTEPQIWLDLGCGSGTFTLALAEILPLGSQVIGIDENQQTLPNRGGNGNTVSFLKADMNEILDLAKPISGVLMANSLHYISNQKQFIEQIKELMSHSAQFILIEYDTEQSNQWIPYPIPYNRIADLFGTTNITRIGERKSMYNSSMMYVAQIIY